MRRISAVLILLAAGVLAGCSAGGGSSDGAEAPRSTTTKAPATTTTIAFDRDEYREAMVTAVGDQASGEESVECLADGTLDALGVDALVAAGITPDDVAEGAFFPDLGLDAAEEAALARSLGEVVRTCGVGRAIFREQIAEEDDAGAFSDEGIDCAGDALSGQIGETLVDVLKDPDTDTYQAGRDMAPRALAACPRFALDLLAMAMEDDGQPLTEDQRACVLEAFTRAGQEHDELDQPLLIEYARPCFGG